MICKDQMNIFNYFGVESDPIYQTLSSLSQGDVAHLGSCVVTINPRGLYEVTNSEVHEPFSSMEGCYEFVQALDVDYSNKREE